MHLLPFFIFFTRNSLHLIPTYCATIVQTQSSNQTCPLRHVCQSPAISTTPYELGNVPLICSGSTLQSLWDEAMTQVSRAISKCTKYDCCIFSLPVNNKMIYSGFRFITFSKLAHIYKGVHIMDLNVHLLSLDVLLFSFSFFRQMYTMASNRK